MGSVQITERGYYRTGFQVAVLLLSTFGLYFVYWLIRSRVEAKRRLQQRNEPWPFWLLLLVPVVFLYPIFSTYALLQKSCRVRLPNHRIPIPFVILGVVHLFLQGMWRFQPTYDLLGFLGVVPIAIMQQYSFEADVENRTVPKAFCRFSWIELAIVVVGGTLFILAFGATFLPAGDGTKPVVLPGLITAAVNLIALAIFWMIAHKRQGRGTVAEVEGLPQGQPDNRLDDFPHT